MVRRAAVWTLIGGGVVAFGVLMFVVGWSAGAHTVAARTATPTVAAPAQNPTPFQEVIPLPGPDRNGSGQGQQQQGQDCQPLILFYYQGRLYQLQPGPMNRQGLPSSPPEYFPLQPYNGPQIPGLPFGPQMPQPIPQNPGFQPVNPRF